MIQLIGQHEHTTTLFSDKKHQNKQKDLKKL